MTEREKELYGTAEDEAASLYALRHRAYLVTLHELKDKGGVSFVTVQASHCNQLHRFADLDRAFDYLTGLMRSGGESENLEL